MHCCFAVLMILILRLFKDMEAPKIHSILIIRHFQHASISNLFFQCYYNKHYWAKIMKTNYIKTLEHIFYNYKIN